MVKLVVVLLLWIFLFNGGVFLYSLVRYRIVKRRSWQDSITRAFIWMMLYAFIATTISDVATSASRNHIYVAAVIEICLVGLPYIAAVRSFIRSRLSSKGIQ